MYLPHRLQLTLLPCVQVKRLKNAYVVSFVPAHTMHTLSSLFNDAHMADRMMN